VWEWLKRGYRQNRFEVETREYVAQNLRHFKRLIARTTPSPEVSLASGSGSTTSSTLAPPGRGSG
jgi:hypothetical protein